MKPDLFLSGALETPPEAKEKRPSWSLSDLVCSYCRLSTPTLTYNGGLPGLLDEQRRPKRERTGKQPARGSDMFAPRERESSSENIPTFRQSVNKSVTSDGSSGTGTGSGSRIGMKMNFKLKDIAMA